MAGWRRWPWWWSGRRERAAASSPCPSARTRAEGTAPSACPLAETADLAGAESVHREAEILLGLTIESFEVVDQARLEELLRPVGDIDVDLPVDVTDADGQVVAESGAQTLDPAAAAAVLAARDPSVPAVEQYPAATAVWAAIAEAVGDGIDVAALGSEPAAPSESTDGVADVLAQAMAGPLATGSLMTNSVPAARNPRDVDVVVLDRAELALVFGQIAPAQGRGARIRRSRSASRARSPRRTWTGPSSPTTRSPIGRSRSCSSCAATCSRSTPLPATCPR